MGQFPGNRGQGFESLISTSATIALATVARPKQQKAKEDRSSFAKATADTESSLTYWKKS